jgi:hypothetical protein
MKKIILLLVIGFAFKTTFAQIPNSSFEDVLSSGLTSYWNPSPFIFPVWIDSNGVSHSDSLSSTSFYSISNDAHSGTRAMELNNIYNYTQQIIYSNILRPTSDSASYNGFSNSIVLNNRPDEFSFYYKFTQVGNDSAYAHIFITDQWNTIADTFILITQPKSTYTYASVPIKYIVSSKAVRATIIFSTSASGAPYANLGTKFLIDDVALTQKTLGIESTKSENEISIYPNPTASKLNIDSKQEIETISVTDLVGKKINNYTFSNHQIDCNQLENGIYFISIKTKNQTSFQKIIIQH